MGIQHKNLNSLILIFSVCLSSVAQCNDINPLLAFYVDTMNKANFKLGMALNDDYEYDEDRPHYYGGFKYADFELGMEGRKITLGAGYHIGHGIDRIGISYADFEKQELAGFEAVISQMGASIKIGYYKGRHNTDNQWLLGIGMGF